MYRVHLADRQRGGESSLYSMRGEKRDYEVSISVDRIVASAVTDEEGGIYGVHTAQIRWAGLNKICKLSR